MRSKIEEVKAKLEEIRQNVFPKKGAMKGLVSSGPNKESINTFSAASGDRINKLTRICDEGEKKTTDGGNRVVELYNNREKEHEEKLKLVENLRSRISMLKKDLDIQEGEGGRFSVCTCDQRWEKPRCSEGRGKALISAG